MRSLLLLLICSAFICCNQSPKTSSEPAEPIAENQEAATPKDLKTIIKESPLSQTNNAEGSYTMTLTTDEIPSGIARKLIAERSIVLIHNGSVIFKDKTYGKGQAIVMQKGDNFITPNSGVSLSRWDIHESGNNIITFENDRNAKFPEGITPKRVFSIQSNVSSYVTIPEDQALFSNSTVMKLEKYDLGASAILNSADSYGVSASIMESGDVSIQGGNKRKSRNEFGETWVYDETSHLSARERSIFYTCYVLPNEYEGSPLPYSTFRTGDRGTQTVLAETGL